MLTLFRFQLLGFHVRCFNTYTLLLENIAHEKKLMNSSNKE